MSRPAYVLFKVSATIPWFIEVYDKGDIPKIIYYLNASMLKMVKMTMKISFIILSYLV